MTLEGTNTYVVGRDPAYVIDPGPADEGHLARVREEGEARGGIEAVVLTHGHADHAEGAGALDAPVLTPSEGERVGPLTAIATPGHSEDHVCLLAGTECFTGDLILGEGSSYVPPDGGSLVSYLDSLRRLQELELTILYPGHGPPVEDPAGKIAEYIEHRLERERKLLTALEAGERSRERLLAIAWDDVPAELRGAARLVMQAHLEKLEAEGRLPGDLTD
jgi:glyoxylase-like metal-dependent hydrolase (beta-lactamase superfamily II)